MKPVFTIIKKELQSFFNSPLAYLFLNIFLILSGWLFFQNYFLIGQADMRGFFDLLPWMFLFLIPAITMKSLAEEKKLGTHELLLTMPLRESHIVLGKWLASLIIVGLALVFSLPIAGVVLFTGPADLGVIVASYLGALLLSAAYCSLGVFLSSLTDNQIIAFLLTVVGVFLFFIVGELFFLQNLPSFLIPFFKLFGLVAHVENIGRGVLDVRDVLYFASFTGFFLYLTVRRVGSRK